MKIVVEVTPADIIKGLRWDGFKCPIALAIGRLLKPEYECCVGGRYIDIYGRDPTNHDLWLRIGTPQDAAEFIRAFDSGGEVKPLSLNIKIPSKLLVRA